jgi:hypothetical protein
LHWILVSPYYEDGTNDGMVLAEIRANREEMEVKLDSNREDVKALREKIEYNQAEFMAVMEACPVRMENN